MRHFDGILMSVMPDSEGWRSDGFWCFSGVVEGNNKIKHVKGFPNRNTENAATIAKFIVRKILKIHKMPEVKSVSAIAGGNTFNFIEQTVYEASKRRGYFTNKSGR